MTRLFLYLIVAACFLACNQPKTPQTTTKPEMDIEQQKKAIALNFINDYVKNANQTDGALPATLWADSSLYVTEGFKSSLKKLMDDAYAKDPVMGLGADPILNAQDYPEKGFELETFDQSSHRYMVKGIDWPDFTLTIKLAQQKGKWLVDGCGLVNMPQIH